MSTLTRRELSFYSAGIRCDAWFFPGATDSPFDGPEGRPVVVMAHGFCGTKDSGLQPFAERLADAGLAVLAFDYRGFGASDGDPRQVISLAGQADDFRAAIGCAASQPGVDENRIVLWGLSLSGGHAFIVAEGRADVCAVISVVPMVNGLAAGWHNREHVGARGMLRSTIAGIGSAIAARTGRSGTLLPAVGPPGSNATLTAPGFEEAYRAIAGPTWRNEVDASVGLQLGGFRADRAASALVDIPVLVQIADFDQAVPAQAAAKAAFAARAEVRHYPCDHFDIFAGRDWFGPTVEDQLFFLTRVLR